MFPERIYRLFSEESAGATSTKVFCKVLYAYLALKIIASWSIWPVLLKYYPLHVHASLLSRVVFFPAHWATHHTGLFCTIVLVVSLASIFLKPNYPGALFLFWMVININKINYPVSNGADFLLVVMFGLTVPLSHFPLARKESIKSIQVMFFNFGLILCQVHIAMIYLASGWNKLINPLWQNGTAIDYVSKLDFLFMPDFGMDMSTQPVVNFTIAWLVILFELTFPFLVWFRQTRKWVLGAGVLFHLLIAIFLSLPDFGLLMIGLYVIFLRDGDWVWMRELFSGRKRTADSSVSLVN